MSNNKQQKNNTSSKKNGKGKNGRQTPEITKRKHRQLKHDSDKNPYRFVWIALILLFISVFTFMSILSFYETWKEDASIVGLEIGNSIEEGVRNRGNHIGAIISDILTRRLFGISSILVPVIILLLALSFVHTKKIKVHNYILALTIFTCLSSVFFGSFFGRDTDIFGAGLGGEMGIYLAEWLGMYLGEQGSQFLIIILIILFIWVVAAKYCIALISQSFKLIFSIIPKRKKENQDYGDIEPENQITNVETVEEHNDEPVQYTENTIENNIGEENSSALEVVRMDNGQLGAKLYDDYIIYLRTEFYKKEDIPEPEANHEDDFTVTIKEPEKQETESDQQTEKTETSEKTDIPDETHEKEENSADNDSVTIDNLTISKSGNEEEVSDFEVNERELYDPTAELSYYKKPTIDLLKKYDESEILVKNEEVVRNKEQIVNTLGTFGINISEIEATVGPTVTLYEIKPAPGVRISKIQSLEKDIALSLAALGIRIIAPIPGKGAIGIEVPNRKKAIVSMYSVIKSAKFHDSTAELPIALGRTIQNETLVLDLAKMPHLLVAGATGQGKSVGLNAIITSLLYKKHPAELKFVMVDPKRLELTPYASLAKHFMAQMEGSDDIILTDTNKVVYTLNSICREMDDRYKLLEDAGVKNLKEYNEKFIHRKLNPEKGHRFLPYIVLIVDEFADLIMTAGREIETPIARIAQLARAAGIHMIIATQRPTTNIITGTIKANFPARIAFRVTSYIDSKTILDRAGADQLIGRGDMLVYHGSDLTRVQCAFVDTPEVEAITGFIGAQQGYFEPYQLPEYQPESEGGNNNNNYPQDRQNGPKDPLLVEVARYVVDNQIGSTSKIQRNFEIGFNRAGRIVDQLEELGIVGKQQGSKPRQVLVQDPVYLEHILDNIR